MNPSSAIIGSDILDDREFAWPKWVNRYVVAVAGPYGLLLLFAPQVQAAILGLPASIGTVLTMRLMGTSEVCAAILSLFALRTRSRALSGALGFGNGVMDGLMTLIMIAAILKQDIPSSAWFDVSLTLSHSLLGFQVFRKLRTGPRPDTRDTGTATV